MTTAMPAQHETFTKPDTSNHQRRDTHRTRKWRAVILPKGWQRGLVFLWAIMMLSLSPVRAGDDIRLIMFEQPACEYCEIWNEEVGVKYDKTEEGRFAPLTRAHIAEAQTQFGIGGVVYTPTFVLVRNGKEVGRLVGYISEDFFWAMLQDLLVKVGFKASG